MCWGQKNISGSLTVHLNILSFLQLHDVRQHLATRVHYYLTTLYYLRQENEWEHFKRKFQQGLK